MGDLMLCFGLLLGFVCGALWQLGRLAVRQYDHADRAKAATRRAADWKRLAHDWQQLCNTMGRRPESLDAYGDGPSRRAARQAKHNAE